MMHKNLLVLFFIPLLAQAEKQLLWGDTHLHTYYSPDAYLNKNQSIGPNEAYRFAKGLPVTHPSTQEKVQLNAPLDFLVIADHAESMGVIKASVEKKIPRDNLSLTEKITAYFTEKLFGYLNNNPKGLQLLFEYATDETTDVVEGAKTKAGFTIPNGEVIEQSTWQSITDAADEHYEPGIFTSLIGWEWTSIPAGANLHRVVFTNSDAKVAQSYQPFSSALSNYPEDLWQWLEETSQMTGADFIAIPHNSNISKGSMFDTITMRNEPVGAAYAEIRKRWEPIVEITQYKGDSETHPSLSPNDPFADFEDYPFYIQKGWTEYKPEKGDFIRSALLRGMQLEQKIGINPYQFGVIGSTDAHTGLAAAEENNFHGKFATDSTPARKLDGWSDNANSSFGWAMGAQGLAAVWAEENTREGILAAMKRRETYATTGPRIGLRFYGGFGIDESLLDAQSSASAAGAVPMGGELVATDAQSPVFVVHAMADPKSGTLDRIQIVKGWVDASGDSFEKVFDVAWSSDERLQEDGLLTPVPNTVNLETGTWSNAAGAADLSAAWTDPEFDPTMRAFYYVRVLEVPTPRHSLLDKIALGGDVDTRRPDVIQERAYSSAIWYQPAR